MKTLRKAFAILMSIMVIAGTFTMPVSAGGTYNPTSNYVSSSGHFNAGSSVFLSNSSSVSSNDGKYDVYLESYTYDGMPANTRPYGAYTYLRAYTSNFLNAAGDLASFDVAGNGYSYNYYSGYGGVGNSYYLKANSSYNGLGASVLVRWHA